MRYKYGIGGLKMLKSLFPAMMRCLFIPILLLVSIDFTHCTNEVSTKNPPTISNDLQKPEKLDAELTESGRRGEGMGNVSGPVAYAVQLSDEAIVKREDTITRILKLIDTKMDTLYDLINVNSTFDGNCTFEIQRHILPPLSGDSEETNSSTIEVLEWLEKIEEFRDTVAANIFSEDDEFRQVWMLLLSLQNSIAFASDFLVESNGSKITVCDPTLLLKCYSNNRCGCHTENVARSTSTKRNTGLDKTLEVCVLEEGTECPIAPSPLFCAQGTNCLTKIGRQPCLIQNVKLDLVEETYKKAFKGGQSDKKNKPATRGRLGTMKGFGRRGRSAPPDDPGAQSSSNNKTTFSISSRITQSFHCACYGYEGKVIGATYTFTPSYITIFYLAILAPTLL